MDDGSDPLFVAATRPTTKFGVPYEAYLANAGLTVLLTTLVFETPLAFVMFFGIHFLLRELARVDPHFFRRWRLFFATRCRNIAVFGVSRLIPHAEFTSGWSDVKACL